MFVCKPEYSNGSGDFDFYLFTDWYKKKHWQDGGVALA